MKNRADEIKKFLLDNVPSHPKDIVSYAVSHFSVTRTTVHRHLTKLIADGKLIKTGTTRQISYALSTSLNKELSFEIKAQLGEFDVWTKCFAGAFSKLPANTFNICEYGFTEIFNNAIDHSEGTLIKVRTTCHGDIVTIIIADDGVGIFKKIAQVFGYSDKRESVLALTKGKLTTDPVNHTGEGVFFTSKAFDKFTIIANNVKYEIDNIEQDWFVTSNNDYTGTLVVMQIRAYSTTKLKNIFDEFTNPKTYTFNKTHVSVQLCKLPQERYISRSQAKRLMLGLDKFSRIILDFKKVRIVGQGFVDEVFRVFKNKHPAIKVEYINANKDVEFMVKRGLTKIL